MSNKHHPGVAVHLSSPAQLAEMMVRLQQVGEGYRVPLIRAAADGFLTLVAAVHGQVIPARHLKQNKPTTIIFSDDHPASSGPDRWTQAAVLLRWASVVVLHATGGRPEHYELVASTTIVMGRVLLVEIQQFHHTAWLKLAQAECNRVINIVPPPGDCHPRMTVPAGTVMQ